MNDDKPMDVETALERYRAAVEEANNASVAAEAGTDLARIDEDADAVKKRLAVAHATVQKAKQQVVAAQKAARDEIERARNRALDLERQIAAQLGPLQEQVDRLQDGISAINLYLGRDEYIHTIREGRPAPADTPVHIRQSVLAMDEEAALVDLAYGGIDFDDIDRFDEWILADPRNLNQVLPEERGVVAIMARRSYISYGDPWADDARNKANQQTWFLIRNGENLYRVLADEFTVGARLIPKVDEFTGMFTDSNGEPLRPGGSKWIAREKAAGHRQRHYMKIALVLQGLVARTAVFHPLPVVDLNLLTQQHYDQGLVRLITDDENAIEQGRPKFEDWLRSINENVRVGARVIGDFGSYWSRNQHWNGRERTYPKYTGSKPDSLQVHILARSSGPGEFSFPYTYVNQYSRSQQISSATYRVHVADQDFIAIDFVKREDIRYYLESRTERRSYLKAFPLLHAVLAFLDKEAEEEAPFRALLRTEVAKAVGREPGDVDDLADDLIRWWKVANKWNRSLNGDQEAEAKAARNIVAEAKRRQKAAANAHVEEALVQNIVGRHPNIIAVARRTSDWVAVEAIRSKYHTPKSPENRYGHSTVHGNVFVNLHFYNKAGQLTETREWTVVDRSQIKRWHLLHATEEWDGWNIDARHEHHLTDAQIDAAVESILAKAKENRLVVAGIQLSYEGKPERALAGYLYAFPEEITYPIYGQELTGNPTRSFKSQKYGIGVAGDGRSWLNGTSWNSGNWSIRGQSHWGGFHTPEDEANKVVEDPWHGHSHQHEMVWIAPNLAEHHAAYLDWYEKEQVVAALERHASRLAEHLADAWMTREYERAHARFLDDYGDEDLWEDHKKTIRVLSVHNTADLDWTAVQSGIRKKVQAREQLAGRTVADVFGDTLDPRLAELRFPEPKDDE